jgi:putative ABC transport system ATP-binding protein
MAILQALQLGKRYTVGETPVEALIDVTLRVPEGEFLAVMGPSGSGKSTLLHLLGGLDTPTRGEVHLAGQRLADLNDRQAAALRRREIGFVFQFFNLLPTLTAEENVALPLILDGQQPADHQARIDGLLELVGLAPRRHHKPDQLSGGEQQRVAIARALVSQPALVLADEPTGNLDSRAGEEVLRLLRRACDERGQTLVLVSHDPAAVRYADRVLLLRDGRLAGEVELHPGADRAAILRQLAGGER